MPRKPRTPRRPPPERLEALAQVLMDGLAPPPSRAQGVRAVRTLPQRADVAWQVTARPLPGLEFSGPPPLLMLVLAAQEGEALFGEVLFGGVVEAEDHLGEVGVTLLGLMQEVGDGPAHRPARVLTPDLPLVEPLGALLAEVGVSVEHAGLPELEALYGEAARAVAGGLRAEEEAGPPPPFLSGRPGEEVRALVAAFRAFMAARPWTVFSADRPLYAEWENGDGVREGLYATVMGELGESFGVALYPDWLAYTGHLNNGGDMERVLEGLGSLEALSLGDEEEFAPEDWAILGRLGLARGQGSQLPGPQLPGPQLPGPQLPSLLRFGLDETLVPRTPVPVLTALLEAMTTRAERRASAVTSLKTEVRGVQIRFPGKPVDELSARERAGSVTLTLRGGELQMLENYRLTITAPADAPLQQVFREARKELAARPEPRASFLLPHWLVRPLPSQVDVDLFFGQPGFTVWREGPRSLPLTVTHLTRLAELECFGQTVRAVWHPEAVPGVAVELTL